MYTLHEILETNALKELMLKGDSTMNNYHDLDDLSTVPRRKSTTKHKTVHKEKLSTKVKKGCALYIVALMLLSGIGSCMQTCSPDTDNNNIEETTSDNSTETSYPEPTTTIDTTEPAPTNVATESEPTTAFEVIQTEPVTTVSPSQNILEPSTELQTTAPIELETTTEEITEPQTLSSDIPQNDEPMVWISETGSKYHRVNDCGKMNPDRARQIPLSQAQQMGYDACSKCY